MQSIMFNCAPEAQRFRIFFFDCVDSTNSRAAELINKGVATDFSIVVADYQTRGRGVDGNRWESSSGENLLFSIILFPSSITPDRQFVFHKIASLAVIDGLKNFLPSALIQIKWPNDIYHHQHKIAGILAENLIIGNEIHHTIIGIGLNVNQTMFDAGLPNPISMAIIAGKTFDRTSVLIGILEEFEKYYHFLQNGHEELIDRAYLHKLMYYQVPTRFISGEKTFYGTIKGVDKYGRLEVAHDGFTSTYGMKEISLVI